MFLNSNSITDILSAIQAMDLSETDNLMLLLAEKNAPNIPSLIEKLKEANLNFFGGIFPSLIVGSKKHDEGLILRKLPAAAPPFLIPHLNSKDFTIPDFEDLPVFETDMSFIVLVDGLTGNIAHFLSEVYNVLGNSVNYIGGGAGSLSLQQQPCLFTKEGFVEDAAILCPVMMSSSLGVRHGWKQVYGPLVANKTEGNIVKELNWMNAFEAYKIVVEKDAGQTLTADNFFSIAKGYPFGISKDNSEKVVRDPISVNENGELVCVGEVPENSVLEILKGENEALIAAAGEAAKDCLVIDKPFEETLVIDCISRVLFLEEDFEKELEVIQNNLQQKSNHVILEGVLTLGEISSHGQGILEFFNKTIVIGLLHDG